MTAPARQRITVVNVVSWVMGGLSCLNLIRDLTPLELFGRLREWLDAYASFVRRISVFLFDWIDWRWLSISATEDHVLIVTVLFALAWTRSTVSHYRSTGAGPMEARLAPSTFMFMFVLLPVALVAILLPDPFGYFVGLCYLAAVVWLFAVRVKEADTALPGRREVRMELYGVLAAFFVLVLLNYVFFRP